MTALIVIAAIALYVAGALAYARWDYIRREVAYRRGQKAPGYHEHCSGTNNVKYEYYYDSKTQGTLRRELPEAHRCDCNSPLGRAALWLPYLLLASIAWAGRRIVCPEIKVPEAERLTELERELSKVVAVHPELRDDS